jgi:hypothetical protein
LLSSTDEAPEQFLWLKCLFILALMPFILLGGDLCGNIKFLAGYNLKFYMSEGIGKIVDDIFNGKEKQSYFYKNGGFKKNNSVFPCLLDTIKPESSINPKTKENDPKKPAQLLDTTVKGKGAMAAAKGSSKMDAKQTAYQLQQIANTNEETPRLIPCSSAYDMFYVLSFDEATFMFDEVLL